MEDKPIGFELQTSFGAFGETDSEQEIPLVSFDNFPSKSREFEYEKKMVIRHCKLNTKTQKQKEKTRKQQKTARQQTETSLDEVKPEVTDLTELHPLIRVEDTDDQLGLHAVSDSSRWISVCPTTGRFMKVKSARDTGTTDSCAPDCMCPEVKSRPSEGSKRGQMHTLAGWKKIANQGEKENTMVTGANEVVQTKWHTVYITRPLSSVTDLLAGKQSAFRRSGWSHLQ